ncbi:hypothetical protein AB4851_07280 [Burkholderia sp. 22PA0099]|uniref:hypothetical protein n=1 Tax=Burkholderia sp. 22PA0099 TaxID=3237372 RepID=UPI0039C388D0
MISFEKAIQIATDNAKLLVKNARNIELEGVVLSSDNKLYEVSLSYDMQGKDPLSIDDGIGGAGESNIRRLARIMSYRREYKIFLVEVKTGIFKGFKNQKDR